MSFVATLIENFKKESGIFEFTSLIIIYNKSSNFHTKQLFNSETTINLERNQASQNELIIPLKTDPKSFNYSC